MGKLRYGRNGSVQLPPRAEKELAGRELEVVSHSSRHLLLAPAGDRSVSLVGLLGEVSVTDLLSFLNLFRKTGVLRFQLSGGQKAIYFQQGEIVFAASSFPEEDLGEILFNLGKVSRADLDKARQFASARATVGKILVEKKAVGPKDLWQATRSQVEDIVYHLFACQEGSYSFVAKPLDEERILRLSMSTQNLIMEGLRRTDERGLYLRRVGSLDARPVPTGSGAEGLTAAEQRLFELLGEGAASARESLRRAGVGEFDGLRLLYQLIEKKAVRMEEVAPAEIDGIPGEVLKIYNGALAVLFKQVAARNPDFASEIRFFLRDVPQPFSFVFRDVVLRADGTLDGGGIAANLAGLEEQDKARLLVDALNELVYMECLAARNALGIEPSAPLLQRVQDISRRVKDLVGGND